MTLPLLSIRCLTYNHEPYIRQCLEGFVMQKTDFPFEAIVHDDASTDNTATIIREYAAKYPDIIKPIYETENQYSKHDGSLRNIMNAATRGKYVAMCEGDDYWTDPLKLQKQVDFLEANPEYSMCFHNAVVVHEYETKEGDIFLHLKEGEYSANDIISQFSVPTASTLFKREILEKMPENNNFQVGDNVLWLTCLRCGKIYCLNERMSVYRKVSTGWMKTNAHVLPYKIIKHSLALKESFPEVDGNIFDKVIIEQYVNLTKDQLRKFNVNFFRIVMIGMMNYHYKYVSKVLLSSISKFAKVLKIKN